MKAARLFLFCGMGADGRLMRPIRVPGVEVVAPDHLEPRRDEALTLLADMNARCPARHIREFGRMAVEWAGAPEPSCPTLSVHGRRDRVIPLDRGEPGVVLEDAGHAFTLTHPKQTSDAIAGFLRSVA